MVAAVRPRVECRDVVRRVEFPWGVMATAMVDVRSGWFPPPPTNSKRPSCAESGGSWSMRAWQAAARHSPYNRSFAVRRRLDGTILARADQERNTRSATAHSPPGPLRGHPHFLLPFNKASQNLLRMPHIWQLRSWTTNTNVALCERVLRQGVCQVDNQVGTDYRLRALKVISVAELLFSCFHSANNVA